MGEQGIDAATELRLSEQCPLLAIVPRGAHRPDAAVLNGLTSRGKLDRITFMPSRRVMRISIALDKAGLAERLNLNDLADDALQSTRHKAPVHGHEHPGPQDSE